MNFATVYGNLQGSTPDIDKLFDRLPTACCCFDVKGELLACNSAWARLFELEDKNEAKEKFPTAFSKKSRSALMKGIKKAIADGEALVKIAETREGSGLSLEITLTRESEEVVTGHAVASKPGYMSDVLFENVPFAIALWDGNGKFVDCNKQTCVLLGIKSPDEYVTRFPETFPEMQPDGTKSMEMARNMRQRALREGFVRHESMRRNIQTGELIPTETSLMRIVRDGVDLLAIFAADLRPVKAAMARETEALSRWNMVLDTLPVGVNMYTDDGEMLDVNDRMLQQFGCKDKEEYFERWRDTLPEYQPDGTLTSERFTRVIKTAFDNGMSEAMDWQMQTIHGEPVPMHISNVVVPSDGGNLLITYTTDLRPIHAQMEKLREEQQFSHILYESSPHGVSIWNSDYKIISTNQQLLDIFGARDFDDFIGNMKNIIPELQPNGINSQEGLSLNLRRAFDGETVRFEWLSKTIWGEALPLEITFVRYLRGSEMFVAAYTVDLRDVKATMEKLRLADERSLILVSAMPIASAFIGPDYYIAECNQAAINLLARTSDAPFEYLHSDDHEVYFCDNICAECEHYQRETCVARRCLIRNWRHTITGYRENPEQMSKFIKNICDAASETGRNVRTGYRQTLGGEELFVETTLVPVNYRGEMGYALYMRDLREAHMREIAEEESRAKTRFLARMSHEIRTPMNAVLGIADIQLQKGNLPKDTEEAFLRIHHSSNLLLSIINDILDLSKVEAGKMEIVPKPYNLYDMIVETAQLNMMHIGEKKLKLRLDIDKNLPRRMIGDELRIKQVMNNLLSNAFKYSQKGTVTLKISSAAYDEAEKNIMLEIEVKDTGQGMSKTQLDTLFEIEFNRLNLQMNRDVQGSGLGMTITYHMVGLMNGKISVESTLGKGTRFTVRIPQEVEGDEVLGESATELKNIDTLKNSLKKIKKIEHEDMNFGSVLVVDDVESNLFVARGMLDLYKISVETVMSGFEAVQKIKDGNVYDIIFMDHMMPDMDGIEATKRIRDEGYISPIVALTANILVGQEEMFLTNGFSGFISKPIDPKKLDACLKKFITNKPTAEMNAAIESGVSELLRDSFLRDADRVARVLSEIFISGDYENPKLYTINAHAIKSALANIGETALSEVAYELEEASMRGDFEKLKAETGHFLEKLAQVVIDLTPAEKESTTYDDTPFLKNQLEKIIAACEVYDKKAAKKAMSALSEKSWTKETKAALDKISTEILHSDFEKAAEIAKTLR